IAHVGMCEVGVVESIQKVRSELESSRFSDWEILLKTDVSVDVSRPNYRTLRRTISERPRSWVSSECRIEPQQTCRAGGFGIAQQRVVAVGTRTWRTSPALIVPIESQREASVPGNNRIHRPVAHNRIHRSGQVLAELLAASDRQFVNGIGADDVLGIPVALGPFRTFVVEVLEIWGCGSCLRGSAPGSKITAVVGHALRV